MESSVFLFKLREEKHISRERLASGVCTAGEIARFEAGKQEINREIFDILLQRLGVSPDKLEVVCNWEQCKESDVLFQFEELVYRQEGEKALAVLEQYITPRAESDRIWKMYACRCHAMYERYISFDFKKAERYLVNALEMTLPGWKADENQNFSPLSWMRRGRSQWENCLISTVEMENLLALAELWLLEERNGQEIELWLENCCAYIQRAFTDEEERAKVLCKCRWLQADCLLRRGDRKSAFLLCEEALELLRDCGISGFMLPLIDRMLDCGGIAEWERQEKRLKGYRDSLCYARQLAGEWRPEASVYSSCCKQERHLDSEIFRQERKVRKLTQEDICDGIFETARSLSQIEQCRKMLRKKNFEQLMERFGLAKGRFNLNVSTDSFEVLKLDNEFARMSAKEQLQDMGKIINALKSQLDMEKPENRRMLQSYELELDWKEQNKSWEELLKKAVCLLEETYLIRNGCYRVPFREEARLMVDTAILLTKLGRKEEAEQLYRQMLGVYKKSKVPERYHYCTQSVIYNNLAKLTNSEELARDRVSVQV